uniref:Integrase core domain-containing protein n=1 Tax=Clytia hemisphaerica TaxID=252671 RepID=A0A7M5WYV8_9CNID
MYTNMADEVMEVVDWKVNERLETDLKTLVKQNLRRKEILDILRQKYPNYPWSLSTLDRRMRHFNLWYLDKTTPIEAVKDAVAKELEGPGKLLGYRALNNKLRLYHDIKVPRNLVADVVFDLDPEGVAARNVKKKKRKAKIPFVADGPGWVFSLDGHDKLMGFQNSTFPLAIYGCLDCFSRKLMFIKVWDSNSNPLTIAKFYMEYLVNSKEMPRFLRIDRGTETGDMGTIHTYLIDKHGNFADPTDSVVYGPSTSNKIERWWRDLHERMELFIKQQLRGLLHSFDYDPTSELDRDCMKFIFIPVVQRECDIFANLWNSHRIRAQKDLELPTGVPNHIFACPEQFGCEKKLVDVSEESLIEVGQLANIDQAPDDYLSPENRELFASIIPNPIDIECKHLSDRYLYLKSQVIQMV